MNYLKPLVISFAHLYKQQIITHNFEHIERDMHMSSLQRDQSEHFSMHKHLVFLSFVFVWYVKKNFRNESSLVL